MSSLDIISMSFRNLLKRKLRTFLTITGVVIGTAAIIVMISLGLAVNAAFEDTIMQMGDIRVLTVRDPNAGMGGMRFVGGGSVIVSEAGTGSGRASSEMPPELDDDAVAAFNRLPNVQAVSPIVEIQLGAASGRYTNPWMRIRGVVPGTMEAFGYTLAEGQFLSGNPNSIVFGSEVGFNFTNPNDPNWWNNVDWDNRVSPVDFMNDRLELSFETGFGWGNAMGGQGQGTNTGPRPRPIRPHVDGILESRDWNVDSVAFMDIDDVLRIRREQQRYQNNEGQRQPGSNRNAPNVFDSVMVMAANANSVEAIRDEIVEMGFHVDSWFIDMLRSMQDMSRSLQLFLGAIGGVSLFVAAIGITNTMIMAIYERTREIGIMKVIGARIKDVKRLFLLEAILIGFLGGAFGVLLSLGISHLLNTFGGAATGGIGGMIGGIGTGTQLSIIPMWLIAVALGFSSLIGLASGYLPARRAMNLSALAAIRME
ncbi:MAG: ABC transporter permease [Oscillospiraceae bacterium]|nr:ABC transporter permease [Oscillospiraceae bacterium]